MMCDALNDTDRPLPMNRRYLKLHSADRKRAPPFQGKYNGVDNSITMETVELSLP